MQRAKIRAKKSARHKYRHILEGTTILFSGGVGQRKNMVCRPTDPRAGPDGYQQIPM
jgi:hypothetical protein